MDSEYPARLPLTLEIAKKAAIYMGASDGKWKAGMSFDSAPRSVVSSFKNVNATFKPVTVRNTDWKNSLVTVQDFELKSLFFPALKTVYENDTSVLNSFFTMFIFCDLHKVGHRQWRNFSGSDKRTKAVLKRDAEKFIADAVKDKYDNRVVIIPEVYYTQDDINRGYVWRTKIRVYHCSSLCRNRCSGLSKRVYEKMPDTPYGEYAQMDFGESRMPIYRNDFVKVYFFVMVMSRSRQKFVYFSCTPFTSALAVYAHELAFAYFGGKPRRIIYDQDKVLLVRENLGDLILTRTFRAFVNEQHFQPVFCRLADPESKGKVENVVKYVKRNFLAGRAFNSLEVLNTEVLQWLEKTGNGKIHGTTRLVPAEEFEIERKYLLPYYGEPVPPKDEPKEYHVRKDNTVRYRTNYYSVPSGTYRNLNTVVWLLENNGHIELYDKESGKLICRHELCPGKGKNVCDKRHHKDKTRSVNDLQVRIRKRTEDDPTVILWLRNLEREKPRYYRDNMKLLLHVISEYGKETVIAALRTCLEKNIYNSLSVQEISGSIHRSKDNMNGMTFQAPTSIPETADCHPEKTDINQYNKFFE
jgi:hypothetical protein